METPEQTDTQSVRDAQSLQSAPATDEQASAWPRLRPLDRFAIALTLLVVAAVTIPRLPPGVCFHDSGELQLASTVLGITHAPGYPGYVTLGYLATLVPGVEPAYMVSLAYLFVGLVAIWLCIMVMVRLRADTFVACGVALALVAVPRVWKNLLAPEVYVPSLTFVAGAVYLLIKSVRLRSRRDLYLAAFLFGVALANRPPVLFTLPFFILAWWLARKCWDASWRQSVRTFTLVVTCGVLPLLYSLGYQYVRDTLQTRYNYIENAHHETGKTPPLADGWRAKVHRVIYHTSAQEFSYAMGNSWDKVWKKLAWLYKEFFLYRPMTFVLVLLTVAVGAVLVFRQCPPALWVLLGMALGSIVFICAYDMYSQAADYLPLLWAAYICGGLAISFALGVCRDRWRNIIAAGFLAAIGTLTVLEARERPGPGLAEDATKYLAAIDMATLPRDAVICVKWPEIPTLFYAKVVLTGRDDIDLIAAQDRHWLRMLEPIHDRPVFVAANRKAMKGQTLTPYRFLQTERPGRGGASNIAHRGTPILWHLER